MARKRENIVREVLATTEDEKLLGCRTFVLLAAMLEGGKVENCLSS